MPTAKTLRHRTTRNRARFKFSLVVEQLEERIVLSAAKLDYVIRPLQGGFGSSALPEGYTPAQIRHAYGFDQISFNNNGKAIAGDGTGTTIAIVDAFDDPSVANDLHQFDLTFGLPDPPSFTKMNQTGGSDLPPPNAGWAGEIALDVEWAHAIAPGAKIVLVEATDDVPGSDGFLTNLQKAASFAADLPNVVAVSMSWGTFSEYAGEAAQDALYFQGHQPVTFVTASGDNGSPTGYPSISPDVANCRWNNPEFGFIGERHRRVRLGGKRRRGQPLRKPAALPSWPRDPKQHPADQPGCGLRR